VRFATRIGYESFSAMRERARDDLRASVNSPLSRFAAEDAEVPRSVLQHLLKQGAHNLEMTETLAGEALVPAALALHSARIIYIVGNRKSYALAVYLHRILSGPRPGVRLVDPAFSDEVAMLGSRDAVVACLFQRYSRSTVAILETAKAMGVRTVVLTDGRGHAFVEGVDHVLVSATDSPTLYRSMIAPIALLEALAAQVAALDPELTRSSLEKAERFNRDQGFLTE
jgi:DNA-binding MurR/RpiR family transcriptional regulator